MSKKKRERNRKTSEFVGLGLSANDTQHMELYAEDTNQNPKRGKNRLWLFGLIGLLSIGVLGAGLNYLQSGATSGRGSNPRNQSFLASLNPFAPAPPPSPTPQLSKEYIYAGSRLLAVEDTLASAEPPADLAVWRPSTGVWYILGVTQTTAWGQAGDKPAQGDFDGDGKTDFCVYRPFDNTWYIIPSSTPTVPQYLVFGLGADTPAPADFDGDGRTDPATFRAATGAWYVFQSTTSSTVLYSLGQSGDKAAAGDYDGDGRADPGVWRPGTGQFHIRRSTDGQTQTVNNFGSLSTDIPVSADYDGDGKANFAVKQGANWIILNAALTSTTTTSWQQSGDIPVPNDYDGDGIVDIAVWRDMKGAPWIIRQSHDLSTRTEYWGTLGDVPVPSFYRR